MDEGMRRKARDKIVRLSGAGLDLVSFWRESTGPIRDVVPHYWSPCFFTLDPASLLITSHFDEGIPELPPDALQREYLEDDVHKLADIARHPDGVSTLHEVTNGDPSTTARWQANIALGGDQEMIASLRTRSGDAWGSLGLYRAPGEPFFDEHDKSFLLSVAPYLAEGARRGLLVGEATDPDRVDPPGLVVLSGDWHVESATPGVERWLDDLPDADLAKGKLPTAVVSVAARALRSVQHEDDSGEVAVARVLSRSGTWVILHGATLTTGGENRAAVIIEPAQPARIAGLLMSVYGLSDREKDVTRLVLQGHSTTEIAESLVVSPHTVQQHLKSVFDKTGVRSRRDLVGKVFFAHYEPRLRDNETRAINGEPLRGEPVERG